MAGIKTPAGSALPVRTIAFHSPAIPDIEAFLGDARRIVASGWLSNGAFVERLEQRLSSWADHRSIVAVSNASDGLIAALSVLVKTGSEVVIPGFTYLATWQSVVWAGMVPVVADVDDDGLLDPAAVEAALSPRTGAILAVHVAGSLAPMAALRDLADRHGIVLLVDAAHALGSQARAPADRGLADAEVFSLGATKQVAAGEAGALAVRDAGHVAAFRRWANQGHAPGAMDAIGPGMNLRLSELTAALAIHQLDGLEVQLARRNEVHERYLAAFAGLPLRLSGPRDHDTSAHKDQLIWVDDTFDRAPLRAAMAAAGVETRPYYEVAVPDLTAFFGIVASADRSRELAARSFAIPIHPRLADDDVERVIESVRTFYRA